MKFAHSLKINAVPEWQDKYVNYPTLKKVIYKLQQEQLQNETQDGSYNVNGISSTTVTELVEKHRIDSVSRKKADSSASKDGRKFHPANLVSRLRQNRNESTHSDLEKTVESSGSDTAGKGDEKGNSIESFTLEKEESAVASFVEGSLDEWSDSSSDSFDPLKVFTKQLLVELSKISEFYQLKEAEIYKQYYNLMKDLESHNVDIDALRFTQAYNHDNADIISQDEHHQYHIKSTLSRTTTNASVFDNINHIENEVDEANRNSATDHSKQDEKHGNIEFEEVAEDDDDDDDDDDDEEHENSKHSVLLSHNDFNVKSQKKIALKRKAITVFISLSELKSYIELNKIGFTKITKKFDKTCNYSIKKDFINNFLPSHSRVFSSDTIEGIDNRTDQVVKVYAFLTGRYTPHTSAESLDDVRTEMKSHLREHIVWERNTVWKDLLSLEKKSYNLNLDTGATQSSKIGDEGNMKSSFMYLQTKKVQLPFNLTFFGRSDVNIPSFFYTWQMVKLAVIIIVFIVLLSIKTFNDHEQHRCLAVLVVSALMWASEALPLYVTAMLVPLLVVTCQVLKDDSGNTMGAVDASTYILGQMWSSVIMLLIGGFTLAAALSKYNIAKVISSYILALAGTKPRNVLISIMAVSLFLSMWISNVAAPVLAYSLIQPVLRTLPTKSPFAQALVLGIALASNIGGMASPIASPQNMIAIESMNPNPGWGKWFAIALPVAVLSLIGIWLELILTFKINTAKVKAVKPIVEKFTAKQIFVSIVCVATIILWCLLTKVEGTFGSSGIIAIVPFVLFFGSGLLKVDDLNNFPWGIVILAMGGIALGKAVSSSGLLATVATALQKKVMHFDVFVILLIFGILVLVVATFVSHTVAVLIIIPLVKEVGEKLPTPHPTLLVMGTALIASAAMGLPTSGFPNVTAISMTDEVGTPYISVNTFITRGVPASIIGYLFIISLGYGIMNSLQF